MIAARPIRTNARRSRLTILSLAAGLSLVLSGCRVGPTYVRPSVPMAPAFKEALPTNFKSDDGWKTAQPGDAQLKGDWWMLFNDPQLNALEAQIDPANQTLKRRTQIFAQHVPLCASTGIRGADHRSRAQRRSHSRLQPPALSECFGGPTPAKVISLFHSTSTTRSICGPRPPDRDTSARASPGFGGRPGDLAAFAARRVGSRLLRPTFRGCPDQAS